MRLTLVAHRSIEIATVINMGEGFSQNRTMVQANWIIKVDTMKTTLVITVVVK